MACIFYNKPYVFRQIPNTGKFNKHIFIFQREFLNIYGFHAPPGTLAFSNARCRKKHIRHGMRHDTKNGAVKSLFLTAPAYLN